MEGDTEDLDEDFQEEDKPTVLWERCIQQSIVVELSEDESLHLSDLESSLALRLSQAESAASEASIHLSGSAQLSALDDSSSSENNDVSSSSLNAIENQNTSITLHLSAQRPNTANDETSSKHVFDDPGQDTGDEDQEYLPHDDYFGSLNQTCSSFENSDGGETVHGSPDPPGLTNKDQKTKPDESFKPFGQTEIVVPTDISHLLLRHFSEGELLTPERLIEAETLPEVSLLESVDDSVLSLAPITSTTANCISKTESTKEQSDKSSRNESLEEQTERKIDSKEKFPSSGSLNQSSGVTGADETKQGRKTMDDDQNQRIPLFRTRSFSEIKYGQGQVHYPLPDFSKVAPKVKIPKSPNGPVKLLPQNPNMIHRVQSSPGMLEVISRVLEESIPASEGPYIFKDSEKLTPPPLVHPMKTDPPSNDSVKQLEFGVETHPKYLISPLPLSEDHFEKGGGSTQHPIDKEATKVLSNWNENILSDGERMTAQLREIIIQFMQKVEEFKCNLTRKALSTTEQQMILRSMMEAQDELERKYISKKEEHRALEMQNFMGLSRNTGTFDPDRLAEGDIFRIGMHLEDIKEVIDRNMYEQISPPQLSSTPSSINNLQHRTPTSRSLHATTPAPSLHESCKEDAQKDEDDAREAEYTSEVHENGGFNQSWELRSADLLKETVGQSINSSQLSSPSCFRDLLDSEDGLYCQTAEDEQETNSDHKDISAQVRRTGSPSRQRQRTPDSPHRDSDSPSVTEPPVNTSCLSQRILSPETDSGFGSSYMNQSATETHQPKVLTKSSLPKFDLSNSDCEASCSNLVTAIHPPTEAAQRSIPPLHYEAAAAVEMWVESTTKAPLVRLQKTDQKRLAPLHHHVPEPPGLCSTMDAVDRRTPLNSCSCNSEAILALQTEVSKLKKDLEQGLVQLPQLEQKMDYLTLKYRQEDSDSRSEVQNQTSSSKTKSSRRVRNSLKSNLFMVEDWISSDMEHSKSKDSGGGSCSEIESQLPDSPVGRILSTSELEDKRLIGVSSLKGENERVVKQRPQAIMSFNSKEKWTPSFHKPLLQVNYGSSCSLPASYKVREAQLQSTSCQRKRSSQSDTALLPSNVYFQQTPSPVSVPLRTKSRRRTKKEENINRTLDQAIELARFMKRTTDHMARRLSADLAKAQLHKKLYHTEPLGGRKHHTF